MRLLRERNTAMFRYQEQKGLFRAVQGLKLVGRVLDGKTKARMTGSWGLSDK